jgi:hypothetical protein
MMFSGWRFYTYKERNLKEKNGESTDSQTLGEESQQS